MSMKTMLKMSTQNRTFRARDRRFVLTVTP